MDVIGADKGYERRDPISLPQIQWLIMAKNKKAGTKFVLYNYAAR